MMSPKTILIFSGFNQRAVIAFLRTLQKNKIPFVIVASSSDDPIFATIYKENVLCTRRFKALDLEDIFDCIKKIQAILPDTEFVIAPSTEALNRFILKYKHLFEKITCSIPLVEYSLYERISNKWTFRSLCKEHYITVPAEYTEIDDLGFPFVAKPKYYFSQETNMPLSPIILDSHQSLSHFKNEYRAEDFYFQEYVHGQSIYLLYYFHRNGSIFKFSQENIIQQPDGKSIVAAVSTTFHKTDESTKYEKLFKAIHYFGLVMVEVKLQDNIHYMIEANPRFWGPSQLFVDAEMNFFEAFLHDFGFLPASPVFVEPAHEHKYFWFGGIIQVFKSQKNLYYHRDNESCLMKDLPNWMHADVYRRPDTYGIFKSELK